MIKIARLADNYRETSPRWFVWDSDEIEARAMSALTGYVGGEAMLRLNIQDAVALASAEAERAL